VECKPALTWNHSNVVLVFALALKLCGCIQHPAACRQRKSKPFGKHF
jgi:starvation-inducible outer membrane lipoprotein